MASLSAGGSPLDALTTARTTSRPLSVNAAVNRRTLGAALAAKGPRRASVMGVVREDGTVFDSWAGTNPALAAALAPQAASSRLSTGVAARRSSGQRAGAGVGAGAGAGAGAGGSGGAGAGAGGVGADGDGEDLLIPEPTPWGDIEFEHVGRKRVKLVKGGTLPQLVTWLAYYLATSEQVEDTPPFIMTAEEDIHYASIFFTALTNMASVDEFIRALRQFYDKQMAGSADCQRSAALQVAGVLTHWLNCHVHLLPARMQSEALDLSDWLLTFLASDSGAALARTDGKAVGLCARYPVVEETLEEAQEALAAAMKRPSAPVGAAALSPALPRASDAKVYTSLWHATTKEIANQLTFMDWTLFQAVPLSEYMENGWDRPRYEHTADNIRAFIDRLNAVSLWVQSAVLDGAKPSDRADIIRRFVSIADMMRELNNFAGLWSVATGLSIDLISRLDETWALVPPDVTAKLEQLKNVFSASDFYQAYRDQLDACPKDSPVVPYLGAHTKELTITFDQMPERMAGRKHLLHFKKYRSLHRIVKPLLAMRERPYNIRANRPLINLLSAALRPFYFHFMEDRDKVTDQLHRRSVALEPPMAPTPAVDYGFSEGSGGEGGELYM